MVASSKHIKSQIDTRLAGGGLTALECCQLQNAQSILNSNIVYSVPNLASLPPAAANEGRFIYVNDINEYRFSNGEIWSDDTSSVISSFRQIWTWGANACGFLGDGTFVDRCSPVREISSSTDWCRVSGGRFNIGAIKTSGQIWSWGSGVCGNLGDGTTVAKCSPVREISSSTDWCCISFGSCHGVAIKTSGQLWSWGGNTCGELADGTTVAKCSPIREICSATDWCQLSAGNTSSMAIKTSGQIWAWGSGICGNLGDGTTVAKCSPIREICSATDWCQASSNSYHSAAVKTSGQIWTWGSGQCGRLGDGTTVSKCSPIREICSATDWCLVSVGVGNTAAIKTSGQIWSWGAGSYGRLADGTTVSKCSPVREICSATDWCQLDSSRISFHSSAIKTSGQLWSWGNNSCGRLGIGNAISACSPVREFCSGTDWCAIGLGSVHSSAIKNVIKGFL